MLTACCRLPAALPADDVAAAAAAWLASGWWVGFCPRQYCYTSHYCYMHFCHCQVQIDLSHRLALKVGMGSTWTNGSNDPEGLVQSSIFLLHIRLTATSGLAVRKQRSTAVTVGVHARTGNLMGVGRSPDPPSMISCSAIKTKRITDLDFLHLFIFIYIESFASFQVAGVAIFLFLYMG